MSNVDFSSKTENPNYPGVIDLSAEEVLEQKDHLSIIDVRQSDEYTGELGHIAGSKHIALDTLASKIDELPKDRQIVFICRSGNRSAQASAMLKMEGNENTFNMAGGMIRWNEIGLPTE